MNEIRIWEIHDRDLVSRTGGGLLRKIKQVLSTARLDSIVFHRATGYSPLLRGTVIVRLEWDQWSHAPFARESVECMRCAPLTCMVPSMSLLKRAIALAEDKTKPCRMIFKEKGIVLEGGDGVGVSLEISPPTPWDPPPIMAEEGEVIHEDETEINEEIASAEEDGLYWLALVREDDEWKIRIPRMAVYATVDRKWVDCPRTIFNPCMLVGRSARGDLRAVKDRRIVVRQWEPRGVNQSTYHSFQITTRMTDYEVEQRFLSIYPV